MTRASDLARLLGAGATINDGTTITTADNTSQLTLQSTDADANAGPLLDMKRDSSSPADGDFLGQFNFLGENDASEEITYAQITGRTVDVSDGTEDGRIAIKTMRAGSSRSALDFSSGETVFNDDGDDVDFRVESDTNANMLFVDGGNNMVGIGTNSPVDLFSVKGTSGASTDINFSGGDDTNDVRLFFGGNSSPFNGAIIYEPDTNNFHFKTSGSERLRIASDGSVMIGQTSSVVANDGHSFNPTSYAHHTRASGPPLFINRRTDSGKLIEFRGDNSEVGNIQVRFGVLQVGSSNCNLLFNSGSGEISPAVSTGGISDGVVTLGANNRRFKNIFMNSTLFNKKTTYALENTEGLAIDDSAQIIMESDNGVLLRLNRMNGNGHGLQFYRGSTNLVGSISFNTSSTTFNTSSDYRLKENVSYDFDATSRLKKLKPARFNFIAEKDITVDGFLAHEVSDIVPEAVSGEKDAMTKEVLYVEGEQIPDGKKVGDVKEASKIDPQGIDQSKLVPLLVKTIQELEARITALESK